MSLQQRFWDTDLLMGVTGILKRNRSDCLKAKLTSLASARGSKASHWASVSLITVTPNRIMLEFSGRHDGLPMSFARAATGLRSSVTNFLASSLISMTLLSRAKRGASGNEATNRDTNPNWMTGGKNKKTTKNQKNVYLTLAVKCTPTGVVFTLSKHTSQVAISGVRTHPVAPVWLHQNTFGAGRDCDYGCIVRAARILAETWMNKAMHQVWQWQDVTAGRDKEEWTPRSSTKCIKSLFS